MNRGEMELQLEERLEAGRSRLLAGDPPRVLELLRAHFSKLSDNLYLIGHMVEQYEDLYDVLIDAETVVQVEIPRGHNRSPPTIRELPMERFQIGSARHRQAFDTAV